MTMKLSAASNIPRASFLTSLAIVVILTLMTILIQVAPAAQAATPPDSCFEFNAATGTITYYYENEGNSTANPTCTRAVTIPSMIGGVTVAHIGDSAFFGANLTSVDIADSVISIDRSAFRYNLLTTVTFPNSVTSIGHNAFSGNQLTSITMTDSMLTLGDFSFSDNEIESITLSESLTGIGYGAFENNLLTSVDIPHTVTDIGDSAFSNNELSSLTLSDSIVSLGWYAFEHNQLTSVTIPASVTSIGNYAFSDNYLTSVIIESTPTIGVGAFRFNGPAFNLDDLSGLQDGTPEGYVLARQYLQDHLALVPVYTVDPSNPADYSNSVEYQFRDFAGNPTTVPTGGYIINPATYTATFTDTTGTTLAPSEVRISPTVTNYSFALNPTADFSQYYAIGDTVTIQPPTISGYETPAVVQHTFNTVADVISIIYTPISVTPAPTAPLATPQPPVTIPAQPVTPAAPETPNADPVTSTDAAPAMQTPTAPSRPDAPSRADEKTTHVEQGTTPIPWVPIAVGSTVTIGAGWGAWLLVRMRMFKP